MHGVHCNHVKPLPVSTVIRAFCAGEPTLIDTTCSPMPSAVTSPETPEFGCNLLLVFESLASLDGSSKASRDKLSSGRSNFLLMCSFSICKRNASLLRVAANHSLRDVVVILLCCCWYGELGCCL